MVTFAGSCARVGSALGTSVEDLFGVGAGVTGPPARLATPAPSSARFLLSEVDGSPVAFPLVGDYGFAPGFRPALAHSA